MDLLVELDTASKAGLDTGLLASVGALEAGKHPLDRLDLLLGRLVLVPVLDSRVALLLLAVGRKTLVLENLP